MREAEEEEEEVQKKRLKKKTQRRRLTQGASSSPRTGRDAIADIEGVLEEVEGRTACKAGTRLL